VKIADSALSFTDEDKPFIALTFYDDCSEPKVVEEILERLTKFEKTSGKHVTYAIEGHRVHIVPPETNMVEFVKLAEKIIAHLTDSITPIELPIRQNIRYINDEFRPKSFEPDAGTPSPAA